jgi:hypothetical protein
MAARARASGVQSDRGGKTVSILAWRNSQNPDESAAHLLLTAEPGVLGDELDPVFGFFEMSPCRFYPNCFHGLRRSTAPLFSVSAREVPWAHMDSLRKRVNSQILFQVFSYPALQWVKRFRIGLSLSCQKSAVLRLPAGRIDSGMVFINDIVRSDPRAPFGGVKSRGGPGLRHAR